MSKSDARNPLFKDRLFRTSFGSTLVFLLVCLAKHILVIAGVSGAIAAADGMEHALVFAVMASGALAVYAFLRHRQRASAGGPGATHERARS